jgi:putative two-component system response regulator
MMPDTADGLNVLVVDDEPAILMFLERILVGEGHTVQMATDGQEALQAIAQQPPDVVLLDVGLPGLDGIEVCRRLKSAPATRLLPVILVTGFGDRPHHLEGIKAGADDFIKKPIDVEELLVRVRSLGRLKRYTDDLDSATAIVITLAEMIEARDGRTEGHCHRMANYATALGRHLGLGDDELRALHRGGFLHDMGMLAIPDGLLQKAGPLTPEEFELVKSHTVIGDSLCQTLRSLHPVRPIVRHHHERLDGSGYPDGLCGDAIPLVAQITALVDTYDAATTRRPYQDAQSPSQALELLRRHVERGWKRHDLVEAFCALIERGHLHANWPVSDQAPTGGAGDAYVIPES